MTSQLPQREGSITSKTTVATPLDSAVQIHCSGQQRFGTADRFKID